MYHKVVLVFFLVGITAWTQAKLIKLQEFTIDLNKLTTPTIVPDGFDGSKLERISIDRIVQGSNAASKQFPYQGALFLVQNGAVRSFCGGSLISETRVLTAAHCLDGMSGAIVCFGCRDINQDGETGRQVQRVPSASNFIIHEGWDRKEIRNDLAIIILPNRVITTEYVQQIALATLPQYDGLPSTVSGWGKTRDSDQGINPVLKYILTKVQRKTDCEKFYRYNVNYEISPAQVCTEGSRGKSTCQGDSGGPLTFSDQGGKPRQVGIVSFGIDLCERKAPSVYTNVNYYLQWINSNL